MGASNGFSNGVLGVKICLREELDHRLSGLVD